MRALPILNRATFLVAWSWAVAGLFLGSGCSQPSGKPSPAADASSGSAVATVATVKPERRTLRHTIAQPGAIQALDQPAIFTKIPGYVQAWKVDVGDRIRTGEVMAELWVPEMDVDVAQKEALVRQAEAQVKMAKEAVPVAEAEYRRAKTQYERLSRVGTPLVDKDAVDETKYGSEASKARLDMARADVGVKEAQYEVAQKNRDYAQTMLQYAKIVAPFDGVVTKRNVNKGDFVQPATGTKGDILFTVARTDIMRIFVEVPELDAQWVTDGMAARVRVQALRGAELAATVTRTSWSLDRTTRTLTAAIDMANPEGKLRPGMYAYATITGERPNVLTLPASAVITQGEVTQGYQSFCYIVQDAKLKRTLVQIGAREGQWVEVLKKQTAAPGEQPKWQDFTGDEVVVAGDLSALSDGQTVQVVGP
jgi:HlyD family secretion protein